MFLTENSAAALRSVNLSAADVRVASPDTRVFADFLVASRFIRTKHGCNLPVVLRETGKGITLNAASQADRHQRGLTVTLGGAALEASRRSFEKPRKR